jgi:hypothetical protein
MYRPNVAATFRWPGCACHLQITALSRTRERSDRVLFAPGTPLPAIGQAGLRPCTPIPLTRCEDAP